MFETDATAGKGALVLGVGNILLTDEGVGVRVVEAFQQRYVIPEGVDVLDGGTAGMDLLDALSSRSHIVIVDAVRTGAEPGTIVRLAGVDVPALFSNRISPHQLGISDVLAILRLVDQEPEHIALIGIVPFDLELGLALSDGIAAKIDQMVDLVARELRSHGFVIKPAEPALG
jgi:hydrogenase maturation protease